MNDLILKDYYQRYDGLKMEFLKNSMPSLFLRLEEISNKPNKTKEDEGEYAILHNEIIEWNEKVRTVEMIYLSLPDCQQHIPNPKLFYLTAKNE